MTVPAAGPSSPARPTGGWRLPLLLSVLPVLFLAYEAGWQAILDREETTRRTLERTAPAARLLRDGSAPGYPAGSWLGAVSRIATGPTPACALDGVPGARHRGRRLAGNWSVALAAPRFPFPAIPSPPSTAVGWLSGGCLPRPRPGRPDPRAVPPRPENPPGSRCPGRAGHPPGSPRRLLGPDPRLDHEPPAKGPRRPHPFRLPRFRVRRPTLPSHRSRPSAGRLLPSPGPWSAVGRPLGHQHRWPVGPLQSRP